MDWFRSWHGAPTDNKWLVIARRAGVTPGVVSAIVWALLDHASQAEPRGHIGDSFDIETYSAFSGFPEEQIEAVLDALQTKGIIDANGDLAAWDRRQPKREDPTAVERKRRQRRKGNGSDDPSGGHDVSRNVTHGHAPEKIREEKNRTDKKEAIASSPLTPAARGGGGWPENGFELFLEAFAHRVDLGAAEREYRKIVGVIPFEELLAAARHHHQTETTTRRMNPSTWLQRERWKDAPAATAAHPSNKQQDSAWTRRLLKHAENAAAQRAGLNGGLTNYDPSHRPIQSPRARALAALGYERASTPAADPGVAAVGYKPPQGS